MKAILMAAGVGSRISRTVKKPKSILDIGDTTIIANTVKMLVKNNIEVAVVVGFQKQGIFDALKDYPVTYYFNPFFKVTNSMASLWFARDFLSGEEDILLANADVFWEQPMLDELLKDDRRIVMLGDKSRVAVGDYFFKTNADNILIDYGKELTLENRSCEYVGIAKLRKDFIPTFKGLLNELVENEVYNMWWENVLYENSVEYPVYIKDSEGLFWGEIDYIEDYERILNYVKNKEK